MTTQDKERQSSAGAWSRAEQPGESATDAEAPGKRAVPPMGTIYRPRRTGGGRGWLLWLVGVILVSGAVTAGWHFSDRLFANSDFSPWVIKPWFLKKSYPVGHAPFMVAPNALLIHLNV